VMNVEDSDAVGLNDIGWLFDKQRVLLEKYKEVEKNSLAYPLDMNLKESQLLVKDFLYRIIEEVGEALEAYEQNFSRLSPHVKERWKPEQQRSLSRTRTTPDETSLPRVYPKRRALFADGVAIPSAWYRSSTGASPG